MAPAVSAAALAYGLLGDDDGFRLWRTRAVEIAGGTRVDQRPDLATFAAFVDARVAVHTGRLDDAAALARRALGVRGCYQPSAEAAGVELAVVAGLPCAHARLARAAGGQENDWAAACLARATGRLRDDADALTASIAAWERLGARFERACTLLLVPGGTPEAHAELTALGVTTPPA
jgi:hypothetical protein